LAMASMALIEISFIGMNLPLVDLVSRRRTPVIIQYFGQKRMGFVMFCTEIAAGRALFGPGVASGTGVTPFRAEPERSQRFLPTLLEEPAFSRYEIIPLPERFHLLIE